MELDPLSLVMNRSAGWTFYFARHYDEAIEQYQKTLELDPNFTLAHLWLGEAYMQKGMHEEAIDRTSKGNGAFRGRPRNTSRPRSCLCVFG